MQVILICLYPLLVLTFMVFYTHIGAFKTLQSNILNLYSTLLTCK